MARKLRPYKSRTGAFRHRQHHQHHHHQNRLEQTHKYAAHSRANRVRYNMVRRPSVLHNTERRTSGSSQHLAWEPASSTVGIVDVQTLNAIKSYYVNVHTHLYCTSDVDEFARRARRWLECGNQIMQKLDAHVPHIGALARPKFRALECPHS